VSPDTDQGNLPVGLEDELPLERIRELLDQLRGEAQEEIGWELGIHCDTLAEGLKEFAARLHGLEEENRHLQERLARGHQDYVELRESMDELLNLHELSEVISSSFNTKDILDSLMDLSKRFIDYESCGAFSLDERNESLKPMSLRDRDGRLEAQVQSQWEDGIIDWVLRERRPVVIDDMDTIDQQEGQECSYVIVPLIVRGEKIGIFTLYCRKAKDTFTAGEIELLGVLANQSAVAIENSRLYTDLETAHEQVVKSQQQLLISAKLAAIGELAGGVAHEVNNPLQIILSRVQLMRAQNQSGEKVMAGLVLVENNVKRISKIIRALLGFSRHNSEVEEWGRYDLAQALYQACALVKHQLDFRMIEAIVECDEGMPEMTGNVGELEQVFINLILNAQNAMAQGGHLRILARWDGDRVEVRFSDTGVGIAPEHLDRIFEPFFTTRADEGGTGLGLSVSYRIIEMHQGAMTVESSLGEGTTFIIRLPPNPQRS
jgi:signal transduction histidine kinase